MDMTKPLIGQMVPDMTLDVFQSNKTKKMNLRTDFAGKWLILFFYPADFTFVCPTELTDIAEKYEELKKLNAEIVSVSTDTVFVHKAWHDNSPTIKDITYPMAADPTGNLCRALGTYIPEEGLSYRASFIIDPEGVIKAFEIHDNSIGRSADELLRKVQAAIYVRDNGGEVCPAKWKPGSKTLKPGMDLVGKI